MSKAVQKEIYCKIRQCRFIQLMKEMGEDSHIDICFECQVVQTSRSRHCYQC